MRKSSLRILLSAMVAGVPRQGGIAWIALQYALGLRRLGHEVLLVEPLDEGQVRPGRAPLWSCENAAYFRDVVGQFGLEDEATLLLTGTRETAGLTYDQVRDWASRADLLVNIGGGLTDPCLLEPIPVRLYLDLDPGFTQLWQAVEGIDMRFDGHTHFATVGLTLGQPGSQVPTCDIDWIPTPQPVVLKEWPLANGIERDALTTIANWRGYGSVEVDGILYGQKAHSLRRFIDLPRRTATRFDLALAIDPGESQDLAALAENGWHLIDPAVVTGTPEEYRRFIQGSHGEFGIAKSGYVEAGCGWFSDRSVCYLASGRPVIAQDTGFGNVLPTGEGLFAFRTSEEVEEAIDELARDYGTQRRAARAIAEECFDSDVVLSSLLTRVGLAA
ncbi:MAG: glycosyltransferase [Gammaproteobacteria bacterium]